MKCCYLFLLLAFSSLAGADERILNFHSDVRVFADGMIEVTETIKVRSEGKQIRRGIYRDFPVEFQDNLGNKHEITVEPLIVLRDDLPEQFHTVRNRRDIRTYFGHADKVLSPGEHTYTFRYRANRMLGFFNEHDELYWNVTGNRWDFLIEKASASVTFEFDVARNAVHIEAYTGRRGSKAQDYSPSMDETGKVTFRANNSLPPAHGLTIVVGWPKGLVTEPSDWQRLQWLLSDNRDLLVALIGFLLLLAYYIPVWRAEGRDPPEGVIVTRYQPPQGFSPASLRYISQMYYDNKVMTAGIVSLAVKGYLQIKHKDSIHSLKRMAPEDNRQTLAAGEQELYEALFADDDDVVTLKQLNHEVLGKAREKHKASLKTDYKKKYFRTNGGLNIPAIIIVLVATVVSLKISDGPSQVLIALIVSMYLTMVFFAIIMKRPTIRGRVLLDEMLGFKDYLEVAEKDDLNLRNPPEKTPELFEAYLPFALALGVDQEWSEKFAALLASMRTPDGNSYSPSWYDGSWNSSNLAATTSAISSGLNSSVSSSVTPPGSSSGSGGGGSSGGGGGGGGGGGW